MCVSPAAAIRQVVAVPACTGLARFGVVPSPSAPELSPQHHNVPSSRTPLILTGYGGFAIAESPAWMPNLAAWCAAGGVYAIAGLALAAMSANAHAIFKGGAVPEKFGWLAIVVFAAIIALTMYVTYLAAKRIKSTQQFYAAGRTVSGLQNGWAIAGDYLSAASFLGIAGLI